MRHIVIVFFALGLNACAHPAGEAGNKPVVVPLGIEAPRRICDVGGAFEKCLVDSLSYCIVPAITEYDAPAIREYVSLYVISPGAEAISKAWFQRIRKDLLAFSEGEAVLRAPDAGRVRYFRGDAAVLLELTCSNGRRQRFLVGDFRGGLAPAEGTYSRIVRAEGKQLATIGE